MTVLMGAELDAKVMEIVSGEGLVTRLSLMAGLYRAGFQEADADGRWGIDVINATLDRLCDSGKLRQIEDADVWMVDYFTGHHQ